MLDARGQHVSSSILISPSPSNDDHGNGTTPCTYGSSGSLTFKSGPAADVIEIVSGTLEMIEAGS